MGQHVNWDQASGNTAFGVLEYFFGSQPFAPELHLSSGTHTKIRQRPSCKYAFALLNLIVKLIHSVDFLA